MDDSSIIGEYRKRAERSVSPLANCPTTVGDVANAKRLVHLHGESIRHTPERGWMVFDGKRWKADESGQLVEFAKDAANSIFRELPELAGADEAQKALFGWAMKSQRLERLRAMIELAKSEPGMPAKLDHFDADPWALNVENGTVDLRTGEIRPHHRENLHARIVPVHYDPAATCPAWERFLERVMPDADTRAYLRRAIGYSLTGRTDEQCLFFAYGTGSNGKSVFLKTVQAIAGEYAMPSRVETFAWKHSGGGIPNDIAALAGSRVVAVSEVDEGQRLNESLVKDMTGGDAITARFLNREFFSFIPRFKLWMQGNHKPHIRGTDNGIWRRIHLVPFFVTIPPEEKDPALFDKLMAEAPGILAWVVRGCLEWHRDGLKPPEAVKAATQAYREEMDVLGAFIEERCVMKPGISIRAKALYENYRVWCDESGQCAYSQNRFGKALSERGITKAKDREGWFYLGIGLLVTDVTLCDPFL